MSKYFLLPIAIVVFSFFCANASNIYGEENHDKIAASFGYSYSSSIESIKHIYQEGGIERLKKTLFYVGEFSINYRTSQIVDGYIIYTIPSSIRHFVSYQMIATLPLKGEPTAKGLFIPGTYYKILDMAEFTGLDGFPIKIPILERVMDKELMIGYGTPPDDQECRNLIIGSWSTGWIKNSTEIFINIGTYQTGGIYEVVRYSKELSSGTWEKRLGKGKWQLKNHILNNSETTCGIWNKDKDTDSWEPSKVSFGSGSEDSYKIIEFKKNVLIGVGRREEIFTRLINNELAVAKKRFNIE